MTSMSNRMNEVMKVLTIIGTIFIPLTFLAGVYGMNMPIPENSKTWAYPAFWSVCVVDGGGNGRLVPQARMDLSRPARDAEDSKR